jgi:transposase
MDSTGLTFQRFRGWSVERLFAWLSRYRRLNTVFDRKADLFVAHLWIAISSILARRLLRSQGIDL